MAIQYSDEQQAALDWVVQGRGSLVLEAVAGAGKTTTLVEMVKRMSGSVFLGAYNTKMAGELKNRVAGMQGVQAGTFHSAGFGALRRAADGRLDTDKNKVRDVVAKMLVGSRYENEDGWAPAACALVGQAKQAGFWCVGDGLVPEPTDRDWRHLVDHFEIDDRLPEGADVSVLVRMGRRALAQSNEMREVIDFDDMIYLPLLRGLRMFQNDWVLIDEAQDTNAVRRALATKMLRPRGRLVAVGDPHQAIYGFSGADGDSLDRIRDQFRAETLHLSLTYRCPKVVVAEARGYVGHISAAATAPDGEYLQMSYDETMKFVEPGDAILCRFNKYLVDACFVLIRAGKPAKIEGRSIGEGLVALASRWKVTTLDALTNKLARYEERELEKARAKDDEAKAERVQDQVETMRVLIARGREQEISTVGGLVEMIRTMFADDVGASPRLVVLSSVHKSKGLEWNRVFVLGRRELMPSPRARQPWQKEQEVNLCYVAVTRAKSTLVDCALAPSDAAALLKREAA